MTKVPYKAKSIVEDTFMLRIFENSWHVVGFDGPSQKKVYNVYRHEITQWIESQPIAMWKFYDFPESMANSYNAGQNYTFTEEMEILFILRWS